MSPGTTNPPLAGRYDLLDQVGAGAMGSVWRARDLRAAKGQESLVAVKVLGAHDSSMLLRFVREQSVRIAHPHVVAPTGWAAEDHRVVFAMDLVRGGSLEELLAERGPLPASYVAVLLDQLLQALDAVHTAGVVHRDVKPANLLLEPGGPHLRLGDFGVAVVADEVRLTRSPGVVGTDRYMAPEQAAGAPPDPRQDLYAAGIVAAQLLGGPRSPLDPLLEALTARDPDLRPPTAADALVRLRRIDVPPDGPWPTVPDRLGDPPAPTRHRWANAVIAVSLVVIAACVVANLVLLR